MSETIIQGNVRDSYVKDMQSYAIAINRKQSVPSCKDGLKTVARRVLTAMSMKEGLSHDKHYSKCAGVIGTTLKYYHPHGDSSVYGVIVALANWYTTKMPLIDGHGNYGNSAGSEAAAYRYTECRLSEFADECVIADLYRSKDIVDWVNNFNDSDKEPEYLPVKVPLLLINGTFGIGIGMRSEIPTHNINEVIDATIGVLRNPNAPVVLIPDHCMECEIVNTNWKVISNTGFGKYKVRAKIDIEYTKNDIPMLVIRSIPNYTTLFLAKGNSDEGIIAKINGMIKDGILPQISGIYSDSKGDNLRYLIKLKRGSDPNYVREFLYKHTLLENTYRVNFEALDGIEGIRFSYKSYIEYFINFSMILKVRTYSSILQKAKTEWTRLQLYIKVMESGQIDALQKKIRTIKNVTTDGRNEFMEWIISRFKVTDIEAKYIMEMDLMKTAPGYLPIYKDKCAKLEMEFNTAFTMMMDDNAIKEEIIQDLLHYKKKYGQKRKCKVIDENEDLIPKGEFKIVITEEGYIKKIGPNDVPSNRDNPKFVIVEDNRKNLILFDKFGKVYKLPVHKIAICDKNSKGFDLAILKYPTQIVSVMKEDTIAKLSKIVNKHFLTVVTRFNCIKKMDLDDFLNVPLSGIIYTKLNEGDYVEDITIIPNNLSIVVYSNKKALVFGMEEVPHYKRTALGVAAMSTNEPIDGISVIDNNATDCVVVTQSGRVNKFDIIGLKKSSRNKAGSSVIKLGKTDTIVSICMANNNDMIRVVTTAGDVDIRVADLRDSSSAASGDKIVPTKGSTILKVKLIKCI